MKFNSEENLVLEIERCLKENGCTTWREVVPDNCENWNLPYRVDLIFYRDDFGFVGIEAKNTNTIRSGGKIAKAIEQINDKYRNQTYFKGNLIEKWGILIPSETIWDFKEDETSKKIKEEIIIVLRGFLNYLFNISLLEYSPESKWRKSQITLNAYTKKVIKIGGDSKYEG